MRRRRENDTAQLDLDDVDIVENRWWRCHDVFTSHYIERRLLRSNRVPSVNECREVHSRLQALWVAAVRGSNF